MRNDAPRLVWFHDSDLGADPFGRRLPATSGPQSRYGARTDGEAEVRHGDLSPCSLVSPAGFDYGQRSFFARRQPG